MTMVDSARRRIAVASLGVSGMICVAAAGTRLMLLTSLAPSNSSLVSRALTVLSIGMTLLLAARVIAREWRPVLALAGAAVGASGVLAGIPLLSAVLEGTLAANGWSITALFSSTAAAAVGVFAMLHVLRHQEPNPSMPRSGFAGS